MSTKILAEGRYRDHALLLLRLVAGLLFFQAGALKIFGWYGGIPGGGSVPLLSQAGVGGILEIVGGVAIALGLFTRPVAFVLAGEMAVAYWQFHFPNGGGWPIQNGGQPAVLYCFLFLYLSASGAGRFSIDAVSRRRTREDLRRGVEGEAHDRLDRIHADARGEHARVAHEEVVEAV
jgi:putative oxidoreductase